jgi:hypothetical protein
MRLFFDLLGAVGMLSVAAGVLIWFAPEDNSENLAMAHFIALLPLGLGAILLLISLIGRVA